MPIEFNCHVCGKLLRTADEKAGRTAKCPGCGESLTVPETDAAPAGPSAADEYGDEGFGTGNVGYDDDDFGAPPSPGGATRACPMCGEFINRSATRCKYCGEDVAGGEHRSRPSAHAADRVAAPAICLMVVAGLGLAVQLLSAVGNMIMLAAAGNPGFQQAQQPFGGMLSGGVGLVFNVMAIVGGIVVFIGAMKMKKLESHGFAMAAAIVAMIPFISPCCLMGLPIGIWAIVVLVDADVKDAFGA